MSYTKLTYVLVIAVATSLADSAAGQTVQRLGSQATQKFVDVSLSADGAFRGSVFSQDGKPIANRSIHVFQSNQPIAQAVSDESGQFVIAGLRGGVYVFTCGDGFGVYRLWAHNSAPPIANPQPVLYAGTVMRGQHGPPCPPADGKGGGILGHIPPIHPFKWIHSPAIVGAAVAGSIALPIALHHDERGS